MSNDYSTPPQTESGEAAAAPSQSAEAAGWVKGNLPAPELAAKTPDAESRSARKTGRRKEKEKEGVPVDAPPPVKTEATNGALSLEALVESLLFVAEGPVSVAQMAEALEVTPREVEAALNTLIETYASGKRGLSVQRFRDKVQLTTAPAAGSIVERFLGLAAQPLTRASLETLAIIAYQQPVTRPRIEAVRGVNSDSVLKNLLSKGLIEEVGRTEGPGRPVLYATTSEFLQHFGLSSLADLPALNLEQPPTLPTPPQEAEPESGLTPPPAPQEFLNG